VPADYRFRANDDQARAPIALPRQQGQAHPSRDIDAPSLQAPLLEEPELTTQYQVLSFERPSGPDGEHGQVNKVGAQSQNDLKESDHALMMP